MKRSEHEELMRSLSWTYSLSWTAIALLCAMAFLWPVTLSLIYITVRY